jgi:anti-anti-sigma factor
MSQVDITVLSAAAGCGVRVVVAGDLDMVTIGGLHAALDAVLAHRPAQVQVDVSAVTFFSCAAAHMLHDLYRCAPGQLALIGAGRPVRRLLEIMQLQPLLGTTALAV